MKYKYIDPYLFFNEGILSKNPIFVEVGSITGKHAKDLKNNYINSNVIVYEASKSSYNNLVKLKDISVFNKAIYDKKGTITFYEYNHPSSNSIYNRENKNKKILNEYEIETISLLDIFTENKIDYIDVLFLNCEGAEIDILTNYLEHGLFDKINQVSVSFHPQIYGNEKMKNFIKKIKSNGLNCITDNRKYNNYLIWK